MSVESPMPRMTPMMPPAMEMMTDSMRNCINMCRLFAPIDMRSPISRVRSVTETYIMFMIPMPPTTSDMPAMQERIMVMMPRIELSDSSISVIDCTWKSSSSPARIWCCSRRISLISATAPDDISSLAAEAYMAFRWRMPAMRRCTVV